MYAESKARSLDLKLHPASSSGEINDSDSPDKVEDDKKKITPRDLLARIPVAGLYNFLHAEKKTERGIWAAILLVTTGITLHYFVPTLTTFLEFKTAVDVSFVYEPSIPFPDVYVEIGNGFNRTYFHEKIRKYERVLKNDSRFEFLMNYVKTKDFYTFFDWVLQNVCSDPRTIGDDVLLVPNNYQQLLNEIIYRTVLAFGSDWPGLRTFFEEGPFDCKQIFNHCEFNGEAFPCCPDDRSHSFIITSWIYYFINITQTATPSGIRPVTADLPYLSFSTRINESESVYSWVTLAISIGNDVKAVMATIIPIEMKSFFLVKPKRRKLLDKCYQRYQYNPANHYGSHHLLQRYFKEMESIGAYTEGRCMAAKLLEEFYLKCGCVPYYDSIKPNDTDICTPAHLYLCFHLAFYELQENDADNIEGVNTKTIVNVLQSFRGHPSECLPLCDTWEYEFQITRTPLAQASPDGFISNQVIVVMDPEYRLEVDVLKIDFITFLASIGDGLSLFLGLSLVTFAQAPFWIVAAILLTSKQRRAVSNQVDSSDMGDVRCQAKA